MLSQGKVVEDEELGSGDSNGCCGVKFRIRENEWSGDAEIGAADSLTERSLAAAAAAAAAVSAKDCA